MTSTPSADTANRPEQFVEIELVAGPQCGLTVIMPASTSKVYVTHLGRTETYWIVGSYKAHWSGWNTATH